jgi:hypothetical protein
MSAISIPIISDFNSKGVDRAIREFKKLETNGEKASFAIKKAALPAAAAIGGLAVVAFDAVKAFMEDDKAAQLLATSLRNTTGATDSQIASVEKFITKTSIAAAVADDELRPALDKLVRGTGDVTKAQDLLSLALDISAGTGKDLGAVSDALSKAFNGNLGPLKKLDPALASLVENGASADEVFAALGETFKGAASTSANTASGKMKSFGIQMDEFKESVGEAVFPLAEKLLPALEDLATWITNNTGLVVGIGVTIAGIATAVLLTNGAIAAWNALAALTAIVNSVLAASFTALWVATGVAIIIAIVAALVLLQVKFNIFGKAVDGIKWYFTTMWGVAKSVFGWIVDTITSTVSTVGRVFGTVVDAITAPFKAAFNGVARLWNNTVGKFSFKVPDWVPGIGGKGFEMPDIPMLANGGIVTSPTLAMIGEGRGPEAVIPLSKLGNMGFGGGSNITVNVNGGDPNSVVRALQQYVRLNGAVPITTRAM